MKIIDYVSSHQLIELQEEDYSLIDSLSEGIPTQVLAVS
jgi:DNA-directed RNA polymerase subunit L